MVGDTAQAISYHCFGLPIVFKRLLYDSAPPHCTLLTHLRPYGNAFACFVPSSVFFYFISIPLIATVCRAVGSMAGRPTGQQIDILFSHLHIERSIEIGISRRRIYLLLQLNVFRFVRVLLSFAISLCTYTHTECICRLWHIAFERFSCR